MLILSTAPRYFSIQGLTIKRLQPRVEAVAEVTLAGASTGEVVVEATLEAESDVRLKETYTTVRALNQPATNVPAALAYSRQLFVTYLDDDLLVSGFRKNESEESLSTNYLHFCLPCSSSM